METWRGSVSSVRDERRDIAGSVAASKDFHPGPMSEAILSRPISNFFFVSFSSLKRPPLLLETNLEKSWVIRLEFYFEKEDSFSFLKFDRDFFLIFREGSKEGGRGYSREG